MFSSCEAYTSSRTGLTIRSSKCILKHILFFWLDIVVGIFDVNMSRNMGVHNLQLSMVYNMLIIF